MNVTPIKKVDSQSELDLLKRILVAEQRDEVEALRRTIAALKSRVEDDGRLRDAISKNLVSALKGAEVNQHRELAEALSPLVVAGIRREISESRDVMVEALYPITGRLVSAAVAHSFRELVADINFRLEAALTFRNLRRRIRALLSGRPVTEIGLAEAARFQIERILLIERESGGLLGAWTAQDEDATSETHVAMMGGLLSAIVGFSRDAFKSDNHDLRSLDLGDRVVLLRSSARRIVAAVGRGVVDSRLDALTDQAFLSLLESTSDGDDEAVTRAGLQRLAASLSAPAMAETEQLRPAPLSLLIVMALLLAGLGYWAVATYQARNAEQRLGAALEAIGKDIGAKGGAVVLERDASRHVVKAVGVLPSETVRRDLEQAIHAQLPGYALDALVVTATGSAASLDAALAARLDRLEATLAETRIESERRLAATARQLSLDIQRAADSASDVASQVRRSREILSARLGSYAVFFRTNTAYRSLEQASATIDAVAAALNESSEAKVRVVGHGDLIGSRAATLEIARIRANKVASDLVQRGIDLGRIVVAARDGSREIVEVNGIGSSNRRVTFELVFPGE